MVEFVCMYYILIGLVFGGKLILMDLDVRDYNERYMEIRNYM